MHYIWRKINLFDCHYSSINIKKYATEWITIKSRLFRKNEHSYAKKKKITPIKNMEGLFQVKIM